jgi:4-hydroxy-3-methylbut-2-enyl diphosphate reductase
MTSPLTAITAGNSANSPVGKPDARTGIFRNGFGLKSSVAGSIAEDYHGSLVDLIRSQDYRLEIGDLTIYLAREFGFCYGVDKAIDFAYQTRAQFPDKKIYLTAEIIHNPRVNRRLLDMGFVFLSGQYSSPGDDQPGSGDVVLLPAFGATVEEVSEYRNRGCVVVDTTCGSVVHVWKRVEKYARDGYTSVIHGKYAHEETRATASQVTAQGGHYIIVRDLAETEQVCAVIRGTASAQSLMPKFSHAVSPGFDAESHLTRVGVANQTTMLSSESLEVARQLGAAMKDRYGEDTLGDHFRSFDTICSATQDRQDAVMGMVQEGLDLLLVLGGYNSSNTMQLLTIAAAQTRAFHIEDSSNLESEQSIRHKPGGVGTAESLSEGWLPKLPARVGITAGASTPNRVIHDTIMRLTDIYGLTQEMLVVHEKFSMTDQSS